MTTFPISAGFLGDGSSITLGAGNVLSSTGGGVASLNSLTGTLSVAEASGGAVTVSTSGGNTVTLLVKVDGATLKIASDQLQIDLTNANTWTGVQTLQAPVVTYGLFNNTASATLTGASSGEVDWSEPEQGTAMKIFVAQALAYKNATGTADTITFTTPFSNTPIIIGNDTGMALTVSTTTLTFPISMSATASGNIVIMGY